MTINNLIKNSLEYSASDWYNLIILGLILFLLENLYNLPGNPPGIDLYDLTVFLIIFLLWILESGYIFKIIEETVHGSKIPPKFRGIKTIFVHGLKENFTFIIYFLIPLIIVALIILDFKTFLKLLELNSDVIFGYLQSSKVFYFAAALVLSLLTYFWYLGVLINMACHNGSIRSGFKMDEILRKIKMMGIGNLSIVYLVIIFVATILVIAFSSSIETIPLTIYKINLGDVLIQLLIAPYTIIFSFRLLELLQYSSP